MSYGHISFLVSYYHGTLFYTHKFGGKKDLYSKLIATYPGLLGCLKMYCFFIPFFSSPGQSPGRAIVLPLALASAAASVLAKSLTLKFFM